MANLKRWVILGCPSGTDTAAEAPEGGTCLKSLLQQVCSRPCRSYGLGGFVWGWLSINMAFLRSWAGRAGV